MPLWLAIIIAILILGLLIFVHELGHYLAARRNGVKVEVFAVGFGPSIWQKQVGDTVYALKLIPLGGYVKLFGEDATSGKAMKAKNSFVSKTPWQRIEIVCAGVVMNLLVAVLLLTLGFGLGVQPLFSDLEDFQKKIDNGDLEQAYGLVVESTETDELGQGAYLKELVDDGEAVAAQDLSIEQIDTILRSGVEDLVTLRFASLAEGSELNFTLDTGETLSDVGVEIYNPVTLLRPQVVSVPVNAVADLQAGDLIWEINQKPILDQTDLGEAMMMPVESLLVWRQGAFVDLVTAKEEALPVSVYINGVRPDSPADQAGVPEQVLLLSVNGELVNGAAQASDLLKAAEAPVELELADGQIVTIPEKENGLVGVYLNEVLTVNSLVEEILFVPVVGSVVPAGEVAVPWHLAPFVAVQESARLAKLTVEGFAGIVSGIFIKFDIPEEVGGPVAVTQITTEFLRYDLASTIWLVAIISLSLAVINILPFPALDGGRLFFILVEVLRGGKRLRPKWEAIAHMLGFALLILLIIIITFNDLGRLL